MPNKDKNIPKRRFKEFENEDAWELRKLGELGEIVTGSTPPVANPEYYSSDTGIPWITPTDIETNIISDSAKKLSVEGAKVGRVVQANSILCTCIASIGKNALLTTIGSFNQQINALTPYPNNDSYFLLTSSELWSIQMKQIASSGTMQIINKTEFSELRTMIPTLPEQEAIGSFFSTLDQQITLHQRKLDKLKHVKQAYLSEMFPAEGERVPKRRFPGFTDDWELRKLGEVVYRSNITSSSKVLPRLEFEDINSGLGTLNKDIFQKVNNDRKGLEFNEGDVLFGKLRPYLKNWWYAEFNGIALGDFWNLKSDVWHSCFLYTYIQSNAFQLVANDTSGTKMPRSDWNLVAESIAKFPSLPEQKAIGTFFSTLDQQITLHQRKLEKLKNLKKALLNELFV
ncbi:TPA: restriction endonuclease subunit S [Streptococcus suis]